MGCAAGRNGECSPYQAKNQFVINYGRRIKRPDYEDTQTIVLFQDTSLVYVISATDFLGAAAKVANRDYRLVEMYTFVAVVYFLVSFGLSTLVKNLQSRIAIIR